MIGVRHVLNKPKWRRWKKWGVSSLLRNFPCLFPLFGVDHITEGVRSHATPMSISWAILHNFWDWGRKTKVANGGGRCPAERLNDKRYADNWLENLSVVTSAVPKRKPPLKAALSENFTHPRQLATKCFTVPRKCPPGR